MLYLKACPRCKGDVQLGEDYYGRYMECLQCSFTLRAQSESMTRGAAKKREDQAASTQAA